LQLISGLTPYYYNKQPHTVMLDIRLHRKPNRTKHADFEKYALQPDRIWALLQLCWEFEPEDRPTIDEVIVDLHDMMGIRAAPTRQKIESNKMASNRPVKNRL
jgi:hypothetical protein